MQSVSWRFSVWFMIMKTDWLERTDRSVFPHFSDSEIQVERSLFDSHIDHAPFLTQTLVTHLTFHSPYSLSQPYDGKFSGLPMLIACSVISISGLDDTGSPDSWYHIWFYKKHYSDICTHRKCGIPSGETIELKILLGNETHKSFLLQFPNSCQVFRTKIRKRHGEVQDIKNPPQNPIKQVRDGHKLSPTTNHLWVTQPFLSAFLLVQYMLLPPSPLPSLPINSSHPSPLVSAISYIPLFHINFFLTSNPTFSANHSFNSTHFTCSQFCGNYFPPYPNFEENLARITSVL